MALCFSTHLSHRGEVRGPDRRKITKEQTSLNLRGAMEGGRRGLKKKKRCRKVEGGMEGERGMGGDRGAKYREERGTEESGLNEN